MADKRMGIVKDDDEDLSYPPTMEGEIERLNRELDNYRHDNIYKLFFAVNRKSGEIADTLNNAELDLTKEDKVFDRFIKLMEKLEPIVKTLAALRQDYLKIPEDEVELAEKKGIPLIERLAKNRAKK